MPLVARLVVAREERDRSRAIRILILRFRFLAHVGVAESVRVVYAIPCSLSLATNAAWLIVPFIELQAPQSSWRFSRWSVPPFDFGTM